MDAARAGAAEPGGRTGRGGAGRNRQLERIAALVDGAGFGQLLGEVYAAPVGRPSYGPLVLLRCLLLQQ
jgi:hypothetical protein